MSGDRKGFKVRVQGASGFVNVGKSKDDKFWASMSAVEIRKKEKDSEEWAASKTWFLNDAYTARALIDKSIALMEAEVNPVEKMESKEKSQVDIDDDDINF